MWMYEKRLQYPVNIKNPDPKMAQFIMSQYGGHGFPVFLQPLTAQEREIFLMEEIIVLHGVKFLIRHGV